MSIAPHEPLLALDPSPPGLDHGTRPGIPAVAEATREPGPEDVEHLHKLKGKIGTGHAQPHHHRDAAEHLATSSRKINYPSTPIITPYLEDTFLRFV